MKLSPVAIERIATLDTSKEYLHIFNLVYFLDSLFN